MRRQSTEVDSVVAEVHSDTEMDTESKREAPGAAAVELSMLVKRNSYIRRYQQKQ